MRDHELETFVQITTFSSSNYRGGGASPQLRKDTTATSGRYLKKIKKKTTRGDSHHAIKYTKNTAHTHKKEEWKNSFLWTGPACAFGLLVLPLALN